MPGIRCSFKILCGRGAVFDLGDRPESVPPKGASGLPPVDLQLCAARRNVTCLIGVFRSSGALQARHQK